MKNSVKPTFSSRYKYCNEIRNSYKIMMNGERGLPERERVILFFCISKYERKFASGNVVSVNVVTVFNYVLEYNL